MPDELIHRVEDTAEAQVLVLEGPLSLRTSPQLSTVLGKLLLDRGRVLVDVSGLRVAWRPSLNVLPAALAAAGGWPAARLVIFGARPDLAAALYATGTVSEIPLAADRDEALRLLARRPRRVRRTTALPSSRDAAPLARMLLADACADWSLTDLEDRARIVVNELVTNAVEHARGPNALKLGLDDRGLTVAVEDESETTDLQDRAQLGLRVVGELSDRWGAIAHRRGKTVWALLRTTPGDLGEGGGPWT